jgi:hypothetical protein
MPISLQTQVIGQTDYAVRMFPETSSTQVTGSPFACAEIAPGLYRVNPAQTDVFSDGRYRLEFIKAGASFTPPLYDFYELKDGAEAGLSSISASVDFAPVLDAIAEIPTNPLLAGSYVAPDNDAIADLAQSVAQIPTTTAPAPSAIATAVQEALEPQLDAIAASADKARAADTNKAIANPITGITTVFADDNTTPLYRILTRNANGEPALEDTVVREVVPLS